MKKLIKNSIVKNSLIKNNRGQSLVEYLIIVALMGVATIGIIRYLQHTVNAKFANVVYSLKGGEKKTAKTLTIKKEHLEKKDFSNFMNGANSSKSSQW